MLDKHATLFAVEELVLPHTLVVKCVDIIIRIPRCSELLQSHIYSEADLSKSMLDNIRRLLDSPNIKNIEYKNSLYEAIGKLYVRFPQLFISKFEDFIERQLERIVLQQNNTREEGNHRGSLICYINRNGRHSGEYKIVFVFLCK